MHKWNRIPTTCSTRQVSERIPQCFFFLGQNPAVVMQNGLDVISEDAKLGRFLSRYIPVLNATFLSTTHTHNSISTMFTLCALHWIPLCLLPDHDEVFLAVYEKTAREPDMMQTLWAFRTRITLQDLTTALNTVPDVKHKHPLLHKFLQEVQINPYCQFAWANAGFQVAYTYIPPVWDIMISSIYSIPSKHSALFR